MASLKKRKEKANEGLLLGKLREGFLGSQLGYVSKLEIIGIGYNVSLDKVEEKTNLVFKLGYSHLLRIEVPSDLLVSLQKGRKLKIEGVNYSKVFNFASTLQLLKLPSAYKKRGIYLEGQKAVKLKAGKRS